MHTSSSFAGSSSESGGFDLNQLTRQLIGRQITAEQFVDQMSVQSDDSCQEKLYNILKNGLFSVSKDELRAGLMLRKALKAGRNWALWTKANQIRKGEQPTKYDYILANRGHKEAEDIVRATKIYGEMLQSIDALETQTPKKIKSKILPLAKQLEARNFGPLLYYLSTLLKDKGLKKESLIVLEKSLDLDCVLVAEKVVGVATGYFMSGGPQLQPKVYELFEKLFKLATNSADPKYSPNSPFYDGICSQLGLMNYHGYTHHAPDRAKALLFFQRAKHLEPAAYNKLGCMYRDGFEGLSRDDTKAMEYFRKAAEGGHVPSMVGLAVCLKAMGSFQEEIREWYLKAAQGGHPGAMHVMSGWYLQDNDKANQRLWNRKAAESGHPMSMINEAYACFGERQFNEAIVWVQRALSVKGNEVTITSDGATVSIHQCCARGWMKRVQNRCFNMLGYIHENGLDGGEKNEPLALSYYTQSAALNDDYGQYNAGRLLIKRVDQFKQGIDYLIRAAHGGNANAMMSLVNVYLSSSTTYNREKGTFWLERANALGDARAKEYLENLEIEESKIEAVVELSNQPVAPVLQILEDDNENEDDDISEVMEAGPSTASSSTEPDDELRFEEEIYPEYTPIRNPKYIRESLRRLNQERQTQIEQMALAPRSQGIALKIMSEGYVSHNELRRFFEDPAFKRHDVRLALTKNGLKVEATNKITGERDSTSTHKVHGTNKPEAFRAKLRKLLQTVFPWILVI